MGKNKKKDGLKKAALQARKEAKADKAAQKRMKKELARQGSIAPEQGNENLDDLLEQYRKRDHKVNSTTFETLGGFPMPRANGSLTYVEDKNGYIYMFGGEYFDGVENIVLDDLLRWDTTRGEWKQILTPKPNPAPRCAHSCVVYKKSLYVFGGELATADQYHHYRDLWKFDTQTNKWEEITTLNTGTIPTARSGHTAFVWKHYMVLVFGFYEALKETRWYNDICVLDLQSHCWLEIPHSKLATRPEPRSACNVGLHGDMAIIYGGFSKLNTSSSNSEAKVHSDVWILHLKPILQGKTPTWERLSARGKGCAPNNRAGTASTSYKGRLLVYGGVQDEDEAHHKVKSVFFSDLFAFDMERFKWYPMRAKTVTSDGKARGRRRKNGEINKIELDPKKPGGLVEMEEESSEIEGNNLGDENEETHQTDSGWDLEMLRSNMFAFIDGDGNIIYEKIDDDTAKVGGSQEGYNSGKLDSEEEEEKEEEKERKEETKVIDNEVESMKRNVTHRASSKIFSSEVLSVNPKTGKPETAARKEPLPRMNASILVRNNVLYVYGGLLEVGDREVTLDDCWAFDLRKQTRWECLYEGTVHKQVWRGNIHDDDDSYISSSTGFGEDSDSDDNNEYRNHDHITDDKVAELNVQETKATKKEKKKASLKQEMAALKSELHLENSNRTPNVEETMAEFYTRTSEFWTNQVTEKQQQISSALPELLTHKEMKREAFALAQARYEQLKPVLKQLDEYEIRQQEAERDNKSRKCGKKEKKEKRKKKNLK